MVNFVWTRGCGVLHGVDAPRVDDARFERQAVLRDSGHVILPVDGQMTPG